MISILLIKICMIPLCSILTRIIFQYLYVFIFIYTLFNFCCEFFTCISYFLGLDFYSYGLILMIFIIRSLITISIYFSFSLNLFIFINLSLRFFLYLIFGSINFLYMYISFEFVLVPLVVLILGWGYQPERLIAGLYLFFYTVLVSLPLLLLIIFIYIEYGTLFFDLIIFNSNFFLVHFVLLVVFIVKMPIFFLHFWLPKAHVQAPVSGSMILAGIILKIGGFGLIRRIYMYEYIYIYYSYVWFSISLVGSLLISILCLVQGDIKCIIAYSSVSHMGLVIIGLITIKRWGLVGSYLLILGHGFCSSALFYMSNIYYLRTNSRRYYINKGLLIFMPRGSILWFIFCSFNMSCPPRLSYLRELIILRRIIGFWLFSFIFFIGISFFCACFSYYIYRYRQHGVYHNLYSFSSIFLVEFLCLFFHLIPLIFISLILKGIF